MDKISMKGNVLDRALSHVFVKFGRGTIVVIGQWN